MNKILVNNNKNIIINNLDEKLVLNGNKTITILNDYLHLLRLEIKPNARIIINDFRIIDNQQTKMEIKIHEGAYLNYNHSFINENNYKLDINIDFLARKAQAKINIHGVNDQGKANIKVDGIISNTKYNNELLENIKIINLNNGKCETFPNILVGNAQVIANHHVTIGKIDENELNYLMSKGISEKQAKILILNGFLTHIIEDKELIIKIKEILNGR